MLWTEAILPTLPQKKSPMAEQRVDFLWRIMQRRLILCIVDSQLSRSRDFSALVSLISVTFMFSRPNGDRGYVAHNLGLR